LIELRDRLYAEFLRIQEKQGKKGIKIEIVKYRLTPEDFETLMLDDIFRQIVKKKVLGHVYVPNIGGYPVVKDETIKKSTIDYRDPSEIYEVETPETEKPKSRKFRRGSIETGNSEKVIMIYDWPMFGPRN